MNFIHTLERIRKAVDTHVLGKPQGQQTVVLLRRDVEELLRDWERLDRDYRALYAQTKGPDHD